jgi:hypothetical protein
VSVAAEENPMKCLIRLCAALFALLLTSAAAPAADAPYAIKIDRPAKVGDAYVTHIVVESSRITTYTLASGPRRDEEILAGDLTARVDVREVDPTGSEKTLTLTVQKFTIGADHKQAVASGQIIEVARSATGVTVNLQGGASLDADARQILGLIYDRLNVSNVSDDDVFGSKTPRQVGDSWPVNAVLAAKQASGADITLQAADVTGQSTLKALATVDGIPALRLATTMTIHNAAPRYKGATVEKSDVKADMNVVVPVDPSLRTLESESTLQTTVTLKLAGDTPTQVDVQGRQHVTRTNTPIKN